MSKEYQAKQAALIAETIKKQDIVITTALIPGRKAPVLVTEEMVKTMKPGSVIVDLAVEQGGNCPLSKPDQVVETDNGVIIMGYTNLPGALGGRHVDASMRATCSISSASSSTRRPARSRSTGTTRSSKAPASRSDGQIVHPALKG